MHSPSRRLRLHPSPFGQTRVAAGQGASLHCREASVKNASVPREAVIVPPQSVSDQVYEVLKEQILLGRIALGERMIAGATAEALQTSRTPVREAFQRLVQDGLAERLVQGGRPGDDDHPPANQGDLRDPGRAGDLRRGAGVRQRRCPDPPGAQGPGPAQPEAPRHSGRESAGGLDRLVAG